MWGIVPAAGAGTRMQPLAFSKELLPVGSRLDAGTERPRAVSEYLVDRLVAGGATKLCIVIAPGKSDILGYFGGSGRLAGQMTFPNAIGIDTRGNVYVGEVDMGKRIQKFAPVLTGAP